MMKEEDVESERPENPSIWSCEECFVTVCTRFGVCVRLHTIEREEARLYTRHAFGTCSVLVFDLIGFMLFNGATLIG